MVSRRILGSGIAAACCSAMAAYGQSAQTIVLPPIDLAATETAQVNIMSANAGYPGWSYVTPCQVSVAFYGADGAALSVPANLTVGNTLQIFSAPLLYASAERKTAATSVSARITLNVPSFSFSTLSPPIPACAIAFSLETHDAATGVTHTYLPGQTLFGQTAVLGAVSGVSCAGDPNCASLYSFEATPAQVIVMPPMGVAATETAQVDITSSAADATGACQGSVAFYGADGSLLNRDALALHRASSNGFTMETTGQIVSADLPYASTGAKGSRAMVSAQIALTPAGSCAGAFSMKTLDSATGVTHAFVAGTSAPGTAAIAK